MFWFVFFCGGFVFFGGCFGVCCCCFWVVGWFGLCVCFFLCAVGCVRVLSLCWWFVWFVIGVGGFLIRFLVWLFCFLWIFGRDLGVFYVLVLVFVLGFGGV